jgi:Domain of unknown function (DUF4145)
VNSPTWSNGAVTARCPNCNSLSQFHSLDNSREFGMVERPITDPEWLRSQEELARGTPHYPYLHRECSFLVRCASCKHAGLAVVYAGSSPPNDGILIEFWPTSYSKTILPQAIPTGIEMEIREAETCASVKAYRGATALLRSALEKALKDSGYKKRLIENIQEIAADHIINESRRLQVDHNIRLLGNDIVHDDWREVTHEEYESALTYATWILNDLYADRPTVESQLLHLKRLQPHPTPTHPAI